MVASLIGALFFFLVEKRFEVEVELPPTTTKKHAPISLSFSLSFSLFLTFFHAPVLRLWRTSCWSLNCSSFSRRLFRAASDSLPKPKRARVVSDDDRPRLAEFVVDEGEEESAGRRSWGTVDCSIIVVRERRALGDSGH